MHLSLMSLAQTVGASLLAMDVNDDAISLGKLFACMSTVGNVVHIRIRTKTTAEATARSKDRSLVALDSSYKRPRLKSRKPIAAVSAVMDMYTSKTLPADHAAIANRLAPTV